MSKPNWPGYQNDGLSITATATAQTSALPGHAKDSDDVLIYNPGPLDLGFRLGNEGVTPATMLSTNVPAGQMQPFHSRGATHISCISTGNQTIKVWCGEGE